MNMKSKRVLVTGSSRGIGKATALELARLGATVVVHGRTMSDELAATYQAVRAASPSSIMATADLARVGEIDALFERIDSELAGLDALVNNAATQKPPGALIDLAVEDWDQVLAVNLRAPFLCAQRAARLMRRRHQGGTILNISSVHAFDPRRNHGDYSTAKGGLQQLTRCLALELAADYITANVLVVGAIATELTPPERQAAISTAIPAGRVGRSDEVAKAVAFLCSEDARYISGASLTIDGGLTLGFCAHRLDL
jgi:NAD(P)-dependent dehydrogenase (short-subunit alcohol dehydrogenase family)